MEHHVYAVWDFMPLVTALQMSITRLETRWSPTKCLVYQAYINQMALEERSDSTLVEMFGATHANHFECYRRAMAEVGANIEPISRFIDIASRDGIEAALTRSDIPVPARRFVYFTFDIIERNQAHLLAAALAYGRETLVPQLFRPLLKALKVSRALAPNLYGYLERHVQLDEQEHGPLAIHMAQELCDGQTTRLADAVEVAEQSLAVRLELWDGILDALAA